MLTGGILINNIIRIDFIVRRFFVVIRGNFLLKLPIISLKTFTKS